MKNWIARWLGAAPAAAPAPSAAPTARAPSADPVDPCVLDAAFWRWLTQDAAGEPPEALRERALAELVLLRDAAARAADLVPRVPEVIPGLLRSLRDENVSAADLARQVARDPALLAETIREANSSFYRPATPVRSIDAAVMVLGLNGLRMLLARAAFRPVIGAGAGPCARLAAPRVWRHAEHCARAAALLAPGLGADPFEAYLAGLVHDVGLVVALRLFDRVLDAPAVPQDVGFAGAALAGARELSGAIALQWELPAPVAAAIVRAGRAGARPLADALGRAVHLARLRLLYDAGALAADDARLAALARPEAEAFARLGGDDA
jgi:HD-like signal output (HDOD) protein